jgi:hypothetical protein
MSTYPGENPQPADDTEPTQPVGDGEPEAGQSPPDAPAPQSPYGAPGPPPFSPPPYSQQPLGGQPYGQQPYSGQPPYYAYSPVPPAHPQSTLAMVLGLVALIGSLFTCGLTLVVAPFAWAVGHSAVKEIEASYGRLGGESQARSGMVMGIVGTVLLILAVLALIAFVVLIVASAGTSTGGSSV